MPVSRSQPDILSPKQDQDQWTKLPSLSTLSVRVCSSLGFTEPQWEAAREVTSGGADGVRMIACDHRRGSECCESTVLALDASQPPGSTATLTAVHGSGAPGVELRYFSEERELLAAFEQ